MFQKAPMPMISHRKTGEGPESALEPSPLHLTPVPLHQRLVLGGWVAVLSPPSQALCHTLDGFSWSRFTYLRGFLSGVYPLAVPFPIPPAIGNSNQ